MTSERGMSMNIIVAKENIIPQWNELAREVEPIFQGQMADTIGFQDFMRKKIEQEEAFIVCSEINNSLMGLITVSRQNNRISWFAVSEQYRNKGIGTVLLTYALNQLDRTKDITVTTFLEGFGPGGPARTVYKKLSFADFQVIESEGHIRSLMKLPPRKIIRANNDR